MEGKGLGFSTKGWEKAGSSLRKQLQPSSQPSQLMSASRELKSILPVPSSREQMSPSPPAQAPEKEQQYPSSFPGPGLEDEPLTRVLCPSSQWSGLKGTVCAWLECGATRAWWEWREFPGDHWHFLSSGGEGSTEG